MAYKIAYLISKGEAPESIIAFTFTKKAAESIKRRVAEALRKFGLSENIDLNDIKKYDAELFERLSCLSDSMSADGYMDFYFEIYLAVQELKKIGKKEGLYIQKFKYLFVDVYQDINPI